MANKVYTINKGVSKSPEFKGLKAQYLWYFAACVLAVLVLFVILYIAGVNSWLCIGIAGSAGGWSGVRVFRMSKKYGEHGLMKARAKKQVPASIRCRSRKIFTKQQ